MTRAGGRRRATGHNPECGAKCQRSRRVTLPPAANTLATPPMRGACTAVRLTPKACTHPTAAPMPIRAISCYRTPRLRRRTAWGKSAPAHSMHVRLRTAAARRHRSNSSGEGSRAVYKHVRGGCKRRAQLTAAHRAFQARTTVTGHRLARRSDRSAATALQRLRRPRMQVLWRTAAHPRRATLCRR